MKHQLSRTPCRLNSSAAQRGWSWIHYGLFGGLVLLVSVGARLLSAQDARIDGKRVQSSVVADYKYAGQLYSEYSTSFFNRTSPLSNPDLLSHPPGYSLVWALIFKLGGGDRAMQLFQIFCDLSAAFVIFLIANELLPRGAAAIAALIIAVAPQFTWNSVILLPDTIAVLPVLLGVYCLIIAAKHGRIAPAMACGIFIGLSCWFRANGLLFSPFCALFAPFLVAPGKRLRFATAMVCGSFLVIAPLTIRNAIVLGHFVPLSLGAGQTMLEGISDYDDERRFGIPNTDIEIMRGEAERFGRADYAQTLFGPDGVARERMRLVQGLRVIAANPFWFAGVMVRRAASMLRLERVPLIAAHPNISRPPGELDMRAALKRVSPRELIVGSTKVSTQISLDGHAVELKGDDSKYGIQLTSQPIRLRPDTDYVFTVPILVKEGRLIVEVSNLDDGRVYARAFADAVQGHKVEEQRASILRLPFVALANEDIELVISNGGSDLARPVAEIGTMTLFELGPASQTWIRIPRVILRRIQSVFVTAVDLPLVILGLLVLLRARCWSTLTILLLVPAYYLCFQSAIHTEYRYVLGLHYFLFVIVATGIWFLLVAAVKKLEFRN